MEDNKTFAETLTERSRRTPNRIWYWLSGYETTKLQLVILGAYDTEDEANQVGLSTKNFSDFEVHALKTRDRAEATREIKHKRLQLTKNLTEAIKRASHKL